MSSYNFMEHEPVVHESAFVAPNATLVGQVELCENTSIWYGTILRGDIAEIKVGKNSNIQDGSVVHVDFGVPCIVGENVTVGHGCILHACTIGNNARIGMGSILLNGVIVEDGAQIAAGSVVPPGKTVKANSLYIGLPAKKIRDHSEKDSEDIKANAEAYVKLSQKFKTGSLKRP